MTGVELRERVEETELGGASLRRLEEEVGQENLFRLLTKLLLE